MVATTATGQASPWLAADRLTAVPYTAPPTEVPKCQSSVLTRARAWLPAGSQCHYAVPTAVGTTLIVALARHAKRSIPRNKKGAWARPMMAPRELTNG